jgi:hypothetical protein
MSDEKNLKLLEENILGTMSKRFLDWILRSTNHKKIKIGRPSQN